MEGMRAGRPRSDRKAGRRGAVRLGKGGVPCSAAGAEVAFAEEAVVVAGDEVGFDLAHGVEHDAHDDQEGGGQEGVGLVRSASP